MSSPGLSRRAFLTLGGGAVLLAACGSSGKSSGTSAGTNAGSKGLSAFRVEIEPYVSNAPQRFAFILMKNNGDFGSGPAATMSIAQPDGSFGPAMAATLHTEGLPKGRGVYTVEPVLPVDGNWRGTVTIEGNNDAELAFPVVANPDTPIVGAMGRAVTSPTVAAPLGVDPLCTRTNDAGDPAPCSFHQVSLDQVIGKGKPVVAMFATPARCQTRYCGPVLDQLIALAPEFGDRITPVHVEIYKDLTSNDLVTATEEWLGFTGEPWIFVMDGTGKVTGRLSGAFATDEIRTLITNALA